MKKYTITSRAHRERNVDLPSSKSISHRALILSSLNSAVCRIERLLDSEDIRMTSDALRTMGVEIRSQEERTDIRGTIGRVTGEAIFLGNSGSSARFLLPLAAFGDRPLRFSGTDRLHQRPFGELLDVLRSMNYRIDAARNSLPAVVHPAVLQGGRIGLAHLPSSQIVSAMMMAGLWMERGLTVQLGSGIPSMAYARMTYRMMQSLQLPVSWDNDAITVSPCRANQPWAFTVEKDMSAASYWVAYALLTGIRVKLVSVKRSSLQGDTLMLDVAEMAGAAVRETDDGTEIDGRISKAFHLDAGETPDLVPTLAVMGMFAPGDVVIHNVRHLEYKESNRIEAIQTNLKRLGGRSEYADGTLRIIPQKCYSGTSIDPYDDHRIAMSFAIAGLRIPGCAIENPECVSKSYPRFWLDFDEWEEQK